MACKHPYFADEIKRAARKSQTEDRWLKDNDLDFPFNLTYMIFLNVQPNMRIILRLILNKTEFCLLFAICVLPLYFIPPTQYIIKLQISFVDIVMLGAGLNQNARWMT